MLTLSWKYLSSVFLSQGKWGGVERGFLSMQNTHTHLTLRQKHTNKTYKSQLTAVLIHRGSFLPLSLSVEMTGTVVSHDVANDPSCHIRHRVATNGVQIGNL